MTGVSPARRLHGARAVLAAGVVLAVAPAASGTAPWHVPGPPAHTATTSSHAPCVPTDTAFTPRVLVVDGLPGPTEILGRGQDRDGVPKPPPLSGRGRWQLAWDKDSGVRPGGPHGVVRLTAHTYPRDVRHGGAPAPALGNLLLARLRTGARLEVEGSAGQRLCYRVTRRQRVRAAASLSGYYDTTGSPRLAILVCSGRRRGPGDWTHRTIWWAHPVGTPHSAGRGA